MVNVRTIALASALLLFVPLYAWADPNPDDPTSYLVEGGAKQVLTVSNVTLVQPPQDRAVEPGSTSQREQLVEGHTVFTVIEVRTRPVDDGGTINVSAVVECSAQTQIHYDRFLGVPIPDGVETTTAACLENATLVAVPDPVPLSSGARVSPLAPDGVQIRYQTPTGEAGYETEYVYQVQQDGRTQTRYAWGVQPAKPWTDASGAPKNLFVSLPVDKLVQMGVRSFHVVDARTLPMSP